MTLPMILAHGGVGAPEEMSDGPQQAAVAGLAVLLETRSSLDAVVEASVLLEDDPRFNAGTGSRIRLDGHSVEMDATLMTSEGEMGGVAALQNVKNPIRVARLVLHTPHALLAGAGAEAFARRMGIEPFDPTTEKAREVLAKVCGKLREKDLSPYYARWRDFQDYDLPELGCDTIGAVARDSEGNFAAANSTGGSAIMLQGRLGDSCQFGAGLWCGPLGAVATTGIGEFIIQKLMAKAVYDEMERGAPPLEACQAGVALFSKDIPVGVIALNASDSGIASNKSLPVGEARAGSSADPGGSP